jgi:hypothetical protein
VISASVQPPVAPLAAPPLGGLRTAAHEVLQLSARVDGAVKRRRVNSEGGDVGGSGNGRALVQHVANYLGAAQLAEVAGVSGPIVDVGGGVGAFACWLAGRLDAEAHLVDADPLVRSAAAGAFPELTVHEDLDAVPGSSAGLVTAMEVIEHIRPSEQPEFVRGLLGLLRPGALLVVSTPDESHYLGGWSGYAPHIGVLDAEGLRVVLGAEAGGGVQVWRMEGAVFALGRMRRVVQPLTNRLWAAADALAPRLVGHATHASGWFVTFARGWLDEPDLTIDTDVRLVDPAAGSGTGLLAAVRVPG